MQDAEPARELCTLLPDRIGQSAPGAGCRAMAGRLCRVAEDRRNAQLIRRLQAVVDGAAGTVHAQLAAADPAIETAFGQMRETPGQKGVETLTGIIVIDHDPLHRLHGDAGSGGGSRR